MLQISVDISFRCYFHIFYHHLILYLFLITLLHNVTVLLSITRFPLTLMCVSTDPFLHVICM